MGYNVLNKLHKDGDLANNGRMVVYATSDLKESTPIEVSDYAHLHNLQDEAASAWWMPHVQK
jgi:hypothetical protein